MDIILGLASLQLSLVNDMVAGPEIHLTVNVSVLYFNLMTKCWTRKSVLHVCLTFDHNYDVASGRVIQQCINQRMTTELRYY